MAKRLLPGRQRRLNKLTGQLLSLISFPLFLIVVFGSLKGFFSFLLISLSCICLRWVSEWGENVYV